MTSCGHCQSSPFVIQSSSPGADLSHIEPDIDSMPSLPLSSPRKQTLKIEGNGVTEILSSDPEVRAKWDPD